MNIALVVRHVHVNLDGLVNADDYFLIDSAFIAQTGPLAHAATPVPEPTNSLFLAFAIAGLVIRRRHASPKRP